MRQFLHTHQTWLNCTLHQLTESITSDFDSNKEAYAEIESIALSRSIALIAALTAQTADGYDPAKAQQAAIKIAQRCLPNPDQFLVTVLVIKLYDAVVEKWITDRTDKPAA
jgi:hypothetical protein